MPGRPIGWLTDGTSIHRPEPRSGWWMKRGFLMSNTDVDDRDPRAGTCLDQGQRERCSKATVERGWSFCVLRWRCWTSWGWLTFGSCPDRTRARGPARPVRRPRDDAGPRLPSGPPTSRYSTRRGPRLRTPDRVRSGSRLRARQRSKHGRRTTPSGRGSRVARVRRRPRTSASSGLG